MLLLLFIAIGICERVVQPSYNITQIRLPNVHHAMTVNQDLQLYQEYDAFSIALYRIQHEDQHKVYIEEDFQHMDQEKYIIEGESGCYTQQHYMSANFIQRVIIPSNASVFYTDMIVAQNRAILIRNDFILNEIYLDESGLVKGHQQMQLNINGRGHPHMVHNTKNKQIYIISENGSISIPDSIPISSASFYVTPQPFSRRNVIYNVFLNEKFYVACGLDGIDVYGYDIQGELKHLSNIRTINNNRLNAMDIQGDGLYLFILDHEVGLLVCDYTFQLLFTIDIIRASDFDRYGNTFIIIAQSINNQDLAIEVFVNFTAQSYYVNRVFSDELQFYDVKMYPEYAVLIGNDAHKLIYHSIYSAFIDHKLEVHSYFPQQQLLVLQDWNNYTVSLSKSELALIKITNNLGQVKCRANTEFNHVYQVFINVLKNGPFESAKYHHAIYVNAQDTSIFHSTNIKLMAAVIIIMFLMVWIAIIGYSCYRKYSNKYNKQEDEKKKLTDKMNQDRDEGPAQELTTI